jgi:hypothetical protein
MSKPYWWCGLTALFLGVISCGVIAPRVSSGDFVGTWRGSSEASSVTTGAIVTLFSDGTFEAKDFPGVLISTPLSPQDPVVDGAGTWELENRKSGEQRIFLDFHEIAGKEDTFSLMLEINASDEGCFFYDFVGDPDNFERYCFVLDQ